MDPPPQKKRRLVGRRCKEEPMQIDEESIEPMEVDEPHKEEQPMEVDAPPEKQQPMEVHPTPQGLKRQRPRSLRDTKRKW